MMKRFLIFLFITCITFGLKAQVPTGYYDRADGKTGLALKTILCTIITKNHKKLSYDYLWEVYKTTDAREDNCLWDMYSDMTNYPLSEPSGSYHEEGDVPNREHSFPKSWWGGNKAIQYSDAMHVIPVDGYVNNRRSNYPYGETSNPTYTSHGGFSKLGPCDQSIGYSGTVFEPNDEYKGDLARIYFYMATRYQSDIASWNSAMLNNDSDQVFTDWALRMLLRWANEDPVSQKEIDRNNAVYNAQKNRNPYVDFPGLEQYVWGSKRGTALNISDYTQPEDTIVDPVAPNAPVFSIEGGDVMQYTTLTITSPENLPIFYTTDGSNYNQAASPVTIVLEQDMTVSAYCERKGIKSGEVSYTFSVTEVEEPSGNIYKLINDEDDLVPGAYYLIVNESKQMALGPASKDVRQNISVTVTDHTIDISDATVAQPTVLQLVRSGNYYAFFIPTEQAYLAVLSDANSLKTETSPVQGSLWTIEFEGSNATITNCKYSERYICYNSTSPRFACYKSTSRQQAVQLYREEQNETAIRTIPVTYSVQKNGIYTLDGRRVMSMDNLRPGIYIINGKKTVIK